MIITCNNCKKKFNIDSNLISDDGRLLQCSNCEHRWFFKKTVSSNADDKDDAIGFDQKNTSNNMEINLLDKLKEKIEVSTDQNLDQEIEKKIEVNINNISSTKTKQKKLDNYKMFNIFIVTIISFLAFVIIIDTFEHPIGKVFPSVELMLYNLYESIKDITLFIKDLI